MKRKIRILSIILISLAVISLIPYTIFTFMPDYDLMVIWGVISHIFIISGCICTFIHSIMSLKDKEKEK